MKKSMMKKIALMAMVGSMVGMHSAWADPVPEPVDIEISSSSVAPTTWGGGSDANGIWGVSGPRTVGQDVVNSIKTSGDVAKTVYGILSQSKSSDESFKMDSLSGGIDVKSTGGYAYAISLEGKGTNTISGLGNITAETSGSSKIAYGIYSKNASTDTANVNFSVSFDSTNGGNISAYSAEGENYGIMFASGSTGTSEVKNVKTITAGVKSDGTITTGMAYGISDADGTNTVTFTGTDSSITAKSAGDMAFGISYGKYIPGASVAATGITTISGLGSITAERISDTGTNKTAYGIYVLNKETDPGKKFSVTMTNGSISVYSASGPNYGIRFDTDSTGTSEVLNVKTIKAGVATTGDSITSGAAYGISDAAGTNTVTFIGPDSYITAKSAGDMAYGTVLIGSGAKTISGLGRITVETTSTDATFKNAIGISTLNQNTIESGKKFSVSFDDTTGGTISVYSESGTNYGIIFNNEGDKPIGTSEVKNVKTITAGVTKNDQGAEVISSGDVYGIYDVAGTNTVTFTGAGSSITAKSSGGFVNGIMLTGSGTKTISGLGSITAEASSSKSAYGIYAEAGTNEVTFKGDGGQAITAKSSGNAYSIYATGQGATTVTFESSVLSGKVKQDGSATLTLTFNNGGVWDVKKDDVSGTVTANVNNGGTIKFAGVNESYSGGNVHVIVSNGGTIDTRSRDDEGKVVTTGGTTKTVDLGSGTFNAQQGSKISLDALTKDNGLTMDQVKTTGIVGGTIALGFVNVKVDEATRAWETAKKTNIFVDGEKKAQTGITIMGTTTTTTDNYVYTFTGGTSGSVSATSVLAEYKLPQVIQANPENAGKADAYSFDKGDITLEADLGTLNNTYRTSGKPEFTIFGNDHSLIANGKGGVTINTGDTLTVKNLTISGFDTFATNTGILNLTDVTFTGTTGTADVVNNATGEVNIAGTVVLDKGIANEGTVFVGEGAVLTGEVRGGGILEFKGNVDIDSPKVANNIKIDDGKKVSIGSATEAKTVDVTSNSIVINKEAELTVKSKDSGKVVMAENVTITGHENGVLRVTEGSFLEYQNKTEKTIKAQDNDTFTVIVEKDATLDPVVSVFAEGVNVQVDGGGTLVLQPGTLFANIHQDAGSVLKVAAEDIKTTALLSGVDKASQLDVSAGTLQLTGTVKLNDSFKLVEGAAVTNGTITMADMWHVQADGLNGLLAEFIMDKGVIGFEVRNVLTAVEANTSALAGVQQGAAAMVNQLTDKVAENLTLALRPAAEGKYDKQVWASYINSKETVDDRDFWNLKGSNTAKYRGAIVGADFYTSDKVIAGMAISYAKGDISANTIDSTHVQNDSKYYGVSFYDRVTNGPVALTYDIGYQYGKNDISMSARENITADVDTQAYTAGVRAERAYKVSKTSTFAPFVSLRYLKLHTKEYKNSNQAKFDANDQNLFIPKLGVAWHGDFVNAKSGWAFKPVAEIGYIFNIGNRSAETKYITATSRAFNTEYDVVDSGTYYGKLGFRVAKKNFFIGADYNYQKGSTTKNSRWNVNLGWSF